MNPMTPNELKMFWITIFLAVVCFALALSVGGCTTIKEAVQENCAFDYSVVCCPGAAMNIIEGREDTWNDLRCDLQCS